MGGLVRTIRCRKCGWEDARIVKAPELLLFAMSALLFAIAIALMLHYRRHIQSLTPGVFVLVCLVAILGAIVPLFSFFDSIRFNRLFPRPLPTCCPACSSTDLEVRHRMWD